MSVNRHTLLSTLKGGPNLLSNGGFTHYAKRWEVLPNTSPDRVQGSVDVIDKEQYGLGSLGFTSSEANLLGSWTISGVLCNITISPVDNQGFVITSRDGGNVAKFTFTEDGSIFLTQELTDLKRFRGVAVSMSCGGINITGNPVVELILEVNGNDISATTASAAAFGSHRRFGNYITLPDVVSSLKAKIKITGCYGEEVGLSGICAVLGHKIKNGEFSSSVVDRTLPSGIVFMFAGDTCPPGFVEAVPDNHMALVSGIHATQSVNNEYVSALGHDEHDHTYTRVDNLRAPSDTIVTTETPISSIESRLVAGADFHRYPSNIAFTPYPGELPQVVLSSDHSHKLRSKMSAIPPTFPIKYCTRL